MNTYININKVATKEASVIDKDDVRVNILSEIEKQNKSTHFSGFGHSIVVIEFYALVKHWNVLN